MAGKKENKKWYLKNITLCAIVRDELMNPAGGINDFVELTAPYVEQAIIVDTGSKDGTREALEELEKEHPNLKIVDHRWNGYADARNVSITHAQTDFCLVLDADERLFQNDFEAMNELWEDQQSDFGFYFHNVDPDKVNIYDMTRNCRLFHKKDTLYVKAVDEQLRRNGKRVVPVPALRKDFLELPEGYDVVSIKHFIPSKEARDAKMRDWYLDARTKQGYENFKQQLHRSPSDIESFSQWKKLNPQRKNYPGSAFLKDYFDFTN